MMNPSQMLSQPTSQGGTTDGYRWYQPPFVSPPFSQQSQAGGLSAQSWFTDLLPTIVPIIVKTVSALQQQGFQPSQVSQQSQAGGLSAQSWFTDLVPSLIPIVLAALQQQGCSSKAINLVHQPPKDRAKLPHPGSNLWLR